MLENFKKFENHKIKKKKNLKLHESAIRLFIAQKLLFANQYVRKWNVTCIASGQ
jgi:hypothetical protein